MSRTIGVIDRNDDVVLKGISDSRQFTLAAKNKSQKLNSISEAFVQEEKKSHSQFDQTNKRINYCKKKIANHRCNHKIDCPRSRVDFEVGKVAPGPEERKSICGADFLCKLFPINSISLWDSSRGRSVGFNNNFWFLSSFFLTFLMQKRCRRVKREVYRIVTKPFAYETLIEWNVVDFFFVRRMRKGNLNLIGLDPERWDDTVRGLIGFRVKWIHSSHPLMKYHFVSTCVVYQSIENIKLIKHDPKRQSSMNFFV